MSGEPRTPGAEPMSRRPHPALRPYVEAYQGYALPGSAVGGSGGAQPIPAMHHGLPSRALTLIVTLDEPLSVGWSPEVTQHGRYATSISGLHARPAYIWQSPRDSGVQVSLTPAGARLLFGLPAAALQTSVVPLDEVVGDVARAVHERMAAAASWAERFTALDTVLLELAARDHTDMRPELAWAWTAFGRGETRTSRVADAVGWSRSHLAGAFRAEFGLRPKELVRVRRFQVARAGLSAPDFRSIADVAADSGYADQAHLTREWRELAGCTPSQWRRDELPNVQAFDAALGTG